MQTKILLSIKPEFAEKILNGEKKFEFRRMIYKSESVNTVVIYASSPVQKVVGEFEVGNVLSLCVRELWNRTMEYSGIEKSFYDDYFKGKDTGYAIEVKKAKKYKSPFDLSELNINFAPQSFVYL